MPRRKINKKKDVFYDVVYNSSLVAKFINGVMKDGKKALAEKELL